MVRRKNTLLLLLAFCFGFAGSVAVSANNAGEESASGEMMEEGDETLGDTLARHGIEIAFGSTNVRNGLATHQKSGRFTGSYDVEIAADLEKLFGITGLGLFIHSEGIDEQMVGSVSGVNADAGGNRSLDVVEVVFEWSLLDDFLTVLVGKMDMAGVFDTEVDIADEVSKALEEIVQSVGKTTNLVGDIAAASQEQTQGVDQVNTAVSQMDKVTQQNAATAGESASAAEQLNAQAESMADVVTQLVALVNGAASTGRRGCR